MQEQRLVSHRSAADFSLIEDETELGGVTQTLCLKPNAYATFLRNLHLPARFQAYHFQNRKLQLTSVEGLKHV